MAWSARKSLDPLRIQKMTKMWSPMGRSHDCPHRQGSFQCVVDTNVLALMRFSPHPHQLSMRCSVSVIVGTANDTAFGAVCIMNIILLLILCARQDIANVVVQYQAPTEALGG